MSWELAYVRPDIRGITAVIHQNKSDIIRTLDGVLTLDARTGQLRQQLNLPDDHSFGYKPLISDKQLVYTVRHTHQDPGRVSILALDPETLGIQWELPVAWRLSHYGSGLLIDSTLCIVNTERRLSRIDTAVGKEQVLTVLPDARLAEYSFALSGELLYFLRENGTLASYDLIRNHFIEESAAGTFQGIAAAPHGIIAWTEDRIHVLPGNLNWRIRAPHASLRRVKPLSPQGGNPILLLYLEHALLGYRYGTREELLFEFIFDEEVIPVIAQLSDEELVVYLNAWDGYRIDAFSLAERDLSQTIISGDLVRGAVCFSLGRIYLSTDKGLCCLRPDPKLIFHG